MIVFELFVKTIVTRNDEHLLNDGADEQIARAVKRLEHFALTTPLTLVSDTIVDLAGFGEAPIHYASADDQYLLLSEVAEALGMPIWQACNWARQDHLFALESQRDTDEERGDGRIGWECMRDLLDLSFDFIVDNPEAKPDAGGRRWSGYGDWLIAQDRLPAFITASPWSREFIDNIRDHMSIGMRKVWGDKLGDLTAVDSEGNRLPGVELFATDLTEEEALRRARRGPTGPLA